MLYYRILRPTLALLAALFCPVAGAQTVVDTVLCDNQLPCLWNGLSLDAACDTSVTLTDVHGEDSTVALHLVVRPTFEVGDTLVVCPYQPYVYAGVDYGGPSDFDTVFISKFDCDSLVHVVLTPRDPLTVPTPELSLDNIDWHRHDTVLLGCLPADWLLRDTTGAASYRWSLWNVDGQGDTLSGGQSSLSATIDSAGIFSFRLISVSTDGCTDTVAADSAFWTFPRPEAAFIWDPWTLPMHQPEVSLINRSSPEGLTYLWTIGTDTTSEESPHYEWEVPATPGDYTVTLAAYWTHWGPDSLFVVCEDTAQHTITITNTFLQFPNLVTPNGDGTNDRWVVVNLLEEGEYSMNELWIYDHWGALVYHAKNIRSEADFWDPNACRCPDGTYYFRFMGKNEYGVVKQNGIIEVVR